MTVYELIQKLSKFPPDLPIVLHRSGQRRRQEICVVTRRRVERRAGERDRFEDAVTVMTDWAPGE